MPMVRPEQSNARRRWIRAIQSGRAGVHSPTPHANRPGGLGDPTLLGRTLLKFSGPDGRLDLNALAVPASNARLGEILINASADEKVRTGRPAPLGDDYPETRKERAEWWRSKLWGNRRPQTRERLDALKAAGDERLVNPERSQFRKENPEFFDELRARGGTPWFEDSGDALDYQPRPQDIAEEKARTSMEGFMQPRPADLQPEEGLAEWSAKTLAAHEGSKFRRGEFLPFGYDPKWTKPVDVGNFSLFGVSPALPASIKRAAKDIDNALGGGYWLYPDGRTMPIHPQTMLDVPVAGGVSARLMSRTPKNGLGLFGGKLAAAAPLKRLSEAEGFERLGFSADDIWKRTGWERGVDGKWRFEVPDTTMKVGALGEMRPNNRMVLGDVIEHSELFKQYPLLRNLQIVHDPEKWFYGAFYPGSAGRPPQIVLGREGRTPQVLLHEIQHAIQRMEGFAKGGSPELFERREARIRRNAARNIRKLERALEQGVDNLEFRDPETWGIYNPATGKRLVAHGTANIRRLLELHRQLKDAPAEDSFLAYRRLAGEVESRTVEERYNKALAAEAAGDTGYLARKPPFRSADTLRERQLILPEPFRHRR